MKEERRPRVLVIDDDPSVREIVRYLIASFGYDCETAADGARGLARFDEGGWDLVVTDLAMPRMSGWEVVEAIRGRSPTMPIVLITGLIDSEVMRRADERGLPVIPKPFREEMLRAVVTKALRASPSFETSSSHQG
jgi:CheY-like chemotaxis protein